MKKTKNNKQTWLKEYKELGLSFKEYLQVLSEIDYELSKAFLKAGIKQ